MKVVFFSCHRMQEDWLNSQCWTRLFKFYFPSHSISFSLLLLPFLALNTTKTLSLFCFYVWIIITLSESPLLMCTFRAKVCLKFYFWEFLFLWHHKAGGTPSPCLIYVSSLWCPIRSTNFSWVWISNYLVDTSHSIFVPPSCRHKGNKTFVSQSHNIFT